MRNITNEALRRLYFACKRNSCFPGKLPVEQPDETISIHVILQSLGLITSTNESTFTQDAENLVDGSDDEHDILETQEQFVSPLSTDPPLSPQSNLATGAAGSLLDSFSSNAPTNANGSMTFGDLLAMTDNNGITGMTNFTSGQTGQYWSIPPIEDQVNMYSQQSISYHKHRMSMAPEIPVQQHDDFLPPFRGSYASFGA